MTNKTMSTNFMQTKWQDKPHEMSLETSSGGSPSVFYSLSPVDKETTEIFQYADQESNNTIMDTIKGLISWQHKKINYQALVAAFRMGAISEEDFYKEEDNYFVDCEVDRCISINEISYRIYFIESFSGINITTSDYEEIFNCDRDTILKSILEINDRSAFLEGLLPKGYA
jgi:hypothetical protein